MKKAIHPLNSRFMQVVLELGYTGSSLAQELQVTEGTISYIRNGKVLPSTNVLLPFLKKHQEINADWLFLGLGDTYNRHSRTDVPSEQVGSEILTRLDGIEKLLKASIESQIERNILTDEAISDGESQIEELQAKVKRLMKGLDKKG